MKAWKFTTSHTPISIKLRTSDGVSGETFAKLSTCDAHLAMPARHQVTLTACDYARTLSLVRVTKVTEHTTSPAITPNICIGGNRKASCS